MQWDTSNVAPYLWVSENIAPVRHNTELNERYGKPIAYWRIVRISLNSNDSIK
jgi:hypothetical protein